MRWPAVEPRECEIREGIPLGLVLGDERPQPVGGEGLLELLIGERQEPFTKPTVERAAFTIDAPLGRDEGSVVAIKDCVRPDGAVARTDVQMAEHFTRAGRAFSRLAVQPHSGRKHQIRIHLAHAGHPIVGDKLYGADELIYLRFVRSELTEADREQLLLENHALHAKRLQFEWRGRAWDFRAEPEAAFTSFAAGSPPEL